MTEITEKNSNIATMSKVLNENLKSHKTVADKSVREVDILKKSLREERKMKQSAFTKVDDLISQVGVRGCVGLLTVVVAPLLLCRCTSSRQPSLSSRARPR